jgi:hypothetical protein
MHVYNMCCIAQGYPPHHTAHVCTLSTSLTSSHRGHGHHPPDQGESAAVTCRRLPDIPIHNIHYTMSSRDRLLHTTTRTAHNANPKGPERHAHAKWNVMAVIIIANTRNN